MCRFVTYLGKNKVTLNEVVDKPKNSLINQSRLARGGRGINADGFGIGWYDLSIENNPSLFKSIQPAWNEPNLSSLISKIRSNCFVGHVRASTIGDVSIANCHPFTYNDFLFAHNGTIRGFNVIKRQLLNLLSDEVFETIKGTTDSEVFFGMLMNIIYKNKNLKNFSVSVNDMADAFIKALAQINSLQKQHKNKDNFSRLNIILTDGKKLIATRYVSTKKRKALSLYYAIGSHLNVDSNETLMKTNSRNIGAILIASEPLTDCLHEWTEVPPNHMLLVDENLHTSIQAIL